MMDRIKVLLISPQFRIVKKSQSIYSKNTLRRAQPILGIGSIATCLENKGYKVRYLDTVIEGIDNTFSFDEDTDCYGLNYEDIIGTVKDFQPNFVGITCLFTSQTPQAVRIASDIKSFNKDIPIAVGGNHASLNFKEIMRHKSFDYVVKGEGEIVFPRLVDTVIKNNPLSGLRSVVCRENGALKENEGFERITYMDSLPFFNWELVPLERYWQKALPQNPFFKSRKAIPYETSRGCPERCIFCSTSRFFGHRFRPKSPKRVIDEICEIVKRYGIEEIQFSDDNMALDFKRFNEICEGLEGLGLSLCSPNGIRLDYIKDDSSLKDTLSRMKRAGFYQVSLAVESGNEYMLNSVIKKRLDLDKIKRLVKIIQDYDIKVHTFFIMGLPYETRQQIYETISYARNLDADTYSFSIATPFPGTELWSWCKKDSLFMEGFKESDLIFGRSVLKRFDDLSAAELEALAEKFAAELNNKNNL